MFGAKVCADGRPSLALSDRTRTACRLYQQGLVDYLVFSGGRDPRAPISEPEAMRRLARRMDIPDEAIILDEGGIDTMASVAAARVLARRMGWPSVLMVSHDYHLSRIKLLSYRSGLAAYTVPAEETRMLTRKPYFVGRELLAWLYCYFVGVPA